MLHLGARPRGIEVAQFQLQPVPSRPHILACEDFHALTGFQFVGERHDGPVHLGSPAAVPDFGMDVIGEIQWRRPVGEIDHVALRGEGVDAILCHVKTELFRNGAGISSFFVPVQHLPQPGDFFLVSAGHGLLRIGALVAPVRTDTQLCLVVHLLRTDLDFENFAFGAEHGGVQRAVTVLLRARDIIVELIGDVAPQPVHQSQRRVTIADFGHQYPHRANIVYLREADTLVLHFAPDAVDVFCAALDFELQAGVVEHPTQVALHAFDELIALQPFAIEQPGDLAVGFGIDVPEREILQLPLEVSYPQAMSQRRIHVEHLLTDPGALRLIVLDGSDGHRAFRQFDQGDAHVIHHGDQHFPDIVFLALCLTEHRIAFFQWQLRDGRHLQHALNQPGHGLAGLAGHLLQGQAFFAHGPVQGAGDETVGIHLQFGEDPGDIQAGEKHIGFEQGVTGLFGDRLLRPAQQLTNRQETLSLRADRRLRQRRQPAIEVDVTVGQ